jgi:hypothetical protein
MHRSEEAEDMAEGKRGLPSSNPESQPFDEGGVSPDYVTLAQPRLLAAAYGLRGGLYGFQNRWSLARHRRALAQRYGREIAEDEVMDDGLTVDEWDR